MKWLKMAILSGLAAISLPGCDTGISSGRSGMRYDVPAVNSENTADSGNESCAGGVCGADLNAAEDAAPGACAGGVCGADLIKAAEPAGVMPPAENPPGAEQMPAPEETADSAVPAVRPQAVSDSSDAAGDSADTGNIQSYEPLTAEQMAILDGIKDDTPPEILDAVKPQNEGKHFLRSDEKHPELFKPSIEGLGGTYIGIGTDQAYVFAGWQKPALAFFVDYDPWVVVLHKIYMLFWSVCGDADCLESYFTDERKAIEFLRGDAGRAAGLAGGETKDIYQEARRSVMKALRIIRGMEEKTFMNDAATYQFIKSMIEKGRYRTYQANLLGDTAFKSMADALGRLGANVTTLYLSNAEQYWGYTRPFKKNMLGLPFSEKALIMRTSATYPHNHDYRYSIQPVSVFKAWLNHPDGRGVRYITRREPVTGPDHYPFVVDDAMPPQTKAGK